MDIGFVYAEFESLSIEYLSAALKKVGHNTKLIFDPVLFDTIYGRASLLKKAFNYRKKIINEIVKSNYGLVCFSVFSDRYGWACDIAREIKKENNDIKIIFGGMHISSVPEYVIKEPFIDYICIGEGEEALVELVSCLEQQRDDTRIKNIWVRRDDEIIKNELRPLIANLDDLPFPDKKIFRREYKYFVENAYTIMTSRGCPNYCTYCYNSYFRELYRGKGAYLRRRSVGNVIEELLYAKKSYNINRIVFFDDIFISDLRWFKEFAEEYKKKIDLPYFCFVHPSYINEESVHLLECSGCSVVTMGIETIDEHIRKRVLSRTEENSQIKLAIDLLRKTKIFIYTNVIFGLPFQDESVMIEEIKFFNQYRVDIAASNWLRYYPKTKIIEIAKNYSLLSEKDLKDIESSREYVPFTCKGHAFTRTGAKLRNMLSISHLLPQKLVQYIMKRRLYMFLPTINIRFYIEALIVIYNKIILKRKSPFAYFSPQDIIWYHFYFMWKKFRFSLK